MSESPFRIEPLSNHNRELFSSGSEPLDRYFHTQLKQDIKRRVTACYIVIKQATSEEIAGYYTLSGAQVLLNDLPEKMYKSLPRYPAVPVGLIGRLAIDKKFQGQKLGAALLFDAALRASRSEIAVFGLAVEAKNEKAISFYKYHGFIQLKSNPSKLLASLKSLI